MANLRKTLQNRREKNEENVIIKYVISQILLTLQKTEKYTHQLKFLLSNVCSFK